MEIGANSGLLEGLQDAKSTYERIRNRRTAIDSRTWSGLDFFWIKPAHVEMAIVTEHARDWLMQEVPRWVRFEEVLDLAQSRS
jgi:hypothetical protein